MKILKRMLQIILGSVVTVIFILGVFLFYINSKDYLPEAVEELQVIHKTNRPINGNSFELISWNIGYAGLGKEMDFFYDGGKKSRSTLPEMQRYLEGIKAFISSEKTADFWLFQEVDFKANRTYGLDQSSELAHTLSDFNYVTAINYEVPFVPVPVTSPMGQVRAGMMSLSAFSPRLSRRYAYPLIAGWPDRMFLLDRCFIELRFTIAPGRELIVLNTHNSAFVDNQRLMDQELAVIRDKMQREYELGNYVIAGGDWNMNPPVFIPSDNYNGHRHEAAAVKFDASFLPEGWKFNFDRSVPTNRALHQSYIKGDNATATIDFFITSPNISVVDMEAIDLGFVHSDHNPVRIKILLQE
ncbi:MAG: endonuclease/exonuclease/phosphatase family protein [Bacteroidetes bacterium]|nr:MAG: endonuclease/exonuclease/phosphatase family protein [Bacteroidota bacterium]